MLQFHGGKSEARGAWTQDLQDDHLFYCGKYYTSEPPHTFLYFTVLRQLPCLHMYSNVHTWTQMSVHFTPLSHRCSCMRLTAIDSQTHTGVQTLFLPCCMHAWASQIHTLISQSPTWPTARLKDTHVSVPIPHTLVDLPMRAHMSAHTDTHTHTQAPVSLK